jgi:hypothetical protein
MLPLVVCDELTAQAVTPFSQIHRVGEKQETVVVEDAPFRVSVNNCNAPDHPDNPYCVNLAASK